ncbi:unnamed protein product [Caenorhabditis angaria]|uniref:Phosphatidylcholine transfer protein n=1 Tax=Caenorhabditis angaria TaxID=860376 RepID=A0A9P1IQV3_9PELO|nr:unnamed protein product [Caenorhabditis angaria]
MVNFFRQFFYFHRHHWTRFKMKTFLNFTKHTRFFDKKPLFLTISSASAIFSFQKHGICEERIKECQNCESEFEHRKNPGHGWELLYEEKDMLAFRRKITGPYEMYEYKCVGTYYDISPRTFLDAQNDINYRREWDENIVSIDVVQEENENELIRWVSKFPYPLYPREYVYVRRTWVSDDDKYAVVDSEAVLPEQLGITFRFAEACGKGPPIFSAH